MKNMLVVKLLNNKKLKTVITCKTVRNTDKEKYFCCKVIK